MSKELYSNAAIGFLSGAVSSTSATSITLADSTMFPSTGNFTVKCDSEILTVSANASNVLTVARGQEGTTAATHADGAAIFSVLTDGSLRRLVRQSHGGTLVGARREINFTDGTGATWTLTDDATNDKVDVAVSVSAGFEAAYTVPVLSDYTWVNQGTATAADDSKGIFMRAPAASQNNVRGLFIATGSAPWSYVVRLAPGLVPAASANCGVAVRDSASGKISVLRAVGGAVNSIDFTNATTYSAGPSGANTFELSSFKWVKVADDGTTNRVWSISSDGTNWVAYYTTTRTSFLTANQVGFFVEGATSGFDTVLRVASAKLN